MMQVWWDIHRHPGCMSSRTLQVGYQSISCCFLPENPQPGMPHGIRCGSRGRGSGHGRGQQGEQGSNFYQALDDNDDYQHSEPAEVEYNSNEQVTPYSCCVESHVHYSPLKPFNAETPEHWLMINSCSTLNLICSRLWLSNIHEVDTTMHIHSTGGGGGGGGGSITRINA